MAPSNDPLQTLLTTKLTFTSLFSLTYAIITPTYQSPSYMQAIYCPGDMIYPSALQTLLLVKQYLICDHITVFSSDHVPGMVLTVP